MENLYLYQFNVPDLHLPLTYSTKKRDVKFLVVAASGMGWRVYAKTSGFAYADRVIARLTKANIGKEFHLVRADWVGQL